jgi:hypothetical protein
MRLSERPHRRDHNDMKLASLTADMSENLALIGCMVLAFGG